MQIRERTVIILNKAAYFINRFYVGELFENLLKIVMNKLRYIYLKADNNKVK